MQLFLWIILVNDAFNFALESFIRWVPKYTPTASDNRVAKQGHTYFIPCSESSLLVLGTMTFLLKAHKQNPLQLSVKLTHLRKNRGRNVRELMVFSKLALGRGRKIQWCSEYQWCSGYFEENVRDWFFCLFVFSREQTLITFDLI